MNEQPLTNALPIIIEPDWPAPANIKALVSTRQGGVSLAPYDSWNMGDHVADELVSVAQNRALLNEFLPANSNVCWLQQIHGVEVVEADQTHLMAKADASVSQQTGQVCAIMTADCLPVLFCDLQGRQVGAAHAGWRGLANGVLLNTLASFSDAGQVIAWLGPGISQKHFEVGQQVFDAFSQYPQAFIPSEKPQHYYADLYQIARQQLLAAGISAVYGGEYCSYSDTDDQGQTQWFSYRRATHQGIANSATGRMVSCIWLA